MTSSNRPTKEDIVRLMKDGTVKHMLIVLDRSEQSKDLLLRMRTRGGPELKARANGAAALRWEADTEDEYLVMCFKIGDPYCRTLIIPTYKQLMGEGLKLAVEKANQEGGLILTMVAGDKHQAEITAYAVSLTPNAGTVGGGGLFH